MKVAIVGAGLMGTGIAWPLSDNNHEIRLVGTHLDKHIIKSCKEQNYHPRLKRFLPDRVTPYYVEEIEQALDGVDFLVSGVNSLGAHWIGKTISPYLLDGQKIIAVTKGLEASSEGELLILPDILYSELSKSIRDKVSLAAIGGPCIAGELAGRRQSCVVFASRDIETAKFLAKAFRTDYYHIWPSSDLLSLEVSVGMKNAYAMAVGMAQGALEKAGGVDEAGALMHNLAAAIFAQGCTEISRVLTAIGADPSFAYKLPGAGDLFVTSAGGRSVTLGKLLAKGHSYAEAQEIMKGETLEAVYIVQQMAQILSAKRTNTAINKGSIPLMEHLIEVITEGKSLDINLDAFF
ncbi:MAG TPA: glycerol-3-phosphate dehydrogenase [Anaerolineae bacterium]|nr:glycerol-3-phosphate dehydrogenase [Anaerolineae bacterium]